MTRKTAPFIKKIGEELIEVLFTNIASNIELENDKTGATVQSYIDSLKRELLKVNEQLAEKLTRKDIVDNLDSDSNSKALSAAQGKILKEKMSEVKTSAYYTDLDINSPEFLDFLESLPDGALISLPEGTVVEDAIIQDLESLSLYLYNYAPLVRTM